MSRPTLSDVEGALDSLDASTGAIVVNADRRMLADRDPLPGGSAVLVILGDDGPFRYPDLASNYVEGDARKRTDHLPAPHKANILDAVPMPAEEATEDDAEPASQGALVGREADPGESREDPPPRRPARLDRSLGVLPSERPELDDYLDGD